MVWNLEMGEDWKRGEVMMSCYQVIKEPCGALNLPPNFNRIYILIKVRCQLNTELPLRTCHQLLTYMLHFAFVSTNIAYVNTKFKMILRPLTCYKDNSRCNGSLRLLDIKVTTITRCLIGCTSIEHWIV